MPKIHLVQLYYPLNSKLHQDRLFLKNRKKLKVAEKVTGYKYSPRKYIKNRDSF